ncbi:hypothetical protein ACFX2A_045455 [Malus domestica]
MEITLNLPIKDWYRNNTVNDLRYWGLDYPPLTAYQSYVHGLFLRYFSPDTVALFASRGHESHLGKLLMRWTVLSSDALVFFPAVLYFVLVYYAGQNPSRRRSDIAWHIAIILLNPCLILIDHGHFQYNCTSLGLTMGAISSVLSDKDLVACVLYSLALNHKQASVSTSGSVKTWHCGLRNIYCCLLAICSFNGRLLGGKALTFLVSFVCTLHTTGVRFLISFGHLCSVVLHVVYLSVHPPVRYPFLFEALVMLVCFTQFVFLTLYANAKQWMLLKDSNLVDKEKKHL